MASKFLITATSSGSGKTTITLGLLKALANRGLRTQPFKCGPDYIDIKFHNLASGNRSINLDLFLASTNHVMNLYEQYSHQADVSVTEGVMGLFDGYNKMHGSSAEIANLLDIPVVLILNAKSMAYSAAAILYGFKHFYKDINVVGVIFNFVSSESHYSFLKDACKDVGLESLGYLPKNSSVEIPSRHLGLNFDRDDKFEVYANSLATEVEKHIDIDRLLSITKYDKASIINENTFSSNKKIKIAIAHDEAFNFTYHENIEKLKSMGTVSLFSPIHDTELPKSDFVYLPGGYPELFLKGLSENNNMRESILKYIESGGKLFAECGGMMYLSSCIVDKDGKDYTMVGIFKQKATMENMKLKLGYRKFEYNNILFKGHEFHYSTLVESEEATIVQQYGAKEQEVDTKLLRYKNAIAGYTHLYWADIDNFMEIFN